MIIYGRAYVGVNPQKWRLIVGFSTIPFATQSLGDNDIYLGITTNSSSQVQLSCPTSPTDFSCMITTVQTLQQINRATDRLENLHGQKPLLPLSTCTSQASMENNGNCYDLEVLLQIKWQGLIVYPDLSMSLSSQWI